MVDRGKGRTYSSRPITEKWPETIHIFQIFVTTMTNAFTVTFYHTYRRLLADSNLQHNVRGKTGI
jgi:hypothetical protein